MGCVISLSVPLGCGYFLSLVVYATVCRTPMNQISVVTNQYFPTLHTLDERDSINAWNYVSLVGCWI